MVTVFHHAPVNTVVLLKNDGLNFDGLVGKHQKCQNFPHQNFVVYIQYTEMGWKWPVTDHWFELYKR